MKNEESPNSFSNLIFDRIAPHLAILNEAISLEQTRIQTKQGSAHVKIICQGFEEAALIRCDVYERVSDLFKINAIIQTKQQVDTEKLVNKNACIQVMLPDQTERFFSGIIAESSTENVPSATRSDVRANNLTCLMIVPTVFRLSLTRKYRIFQDLSAIEIIEQVLKENSISNVKKSITTNGMSERNFCVQYNESDFHFISRLMEEEGVLYYFTHEKNQDTFCFTDKSSGGRKISPGLVVQKHFHEQYTDMSAVYNISTRESLGIRSIQAISFNEDRFATVSGRSDDANPLYKVGVMEHYDPQFDDQSTGDAITKNMIEGENSITKNLQCQSACPNMYSGGICTIKQSAIAGQNGDFFIVEVHHKINQITEDSSTPYYENKMLLIPVNVRFRPVRQHHKMRIYGTQTATVTGPEGEAIFCDEKGRIKVKFHWDTRSSKDDKSSCWIRVAQSWAGKSFGGLIIPRVGMEVLVSFTNGDPDQPLVTGCVYNGVNRPPVDYPQNQNTVSTFYTDSTAFYDGSSENTGGFNELRFNDAKEAEEIYIHAQKDVNADVNHDMSLNIGNDVSIAIKRHKTEVLDCGNKTVILESNPEEKDEEEGETEGEEEEEKKVKYTVLIKKGDYEITINEGNMVEVLDKGNQNTTLTEGHKSLVITKGNESTTIEEGNKTITLNKGNIAVKVEGDISIEANNINITANKKISVQAKESISVKTNDTAEIKATNDLKISSSKGISVKANMDINLAAQMNISEKGLNINREAKVGIMDKSNIICTIESMATSINAKAALDLKGGAMVSVGGGIIKLG